MATMMSMDQQLIVEALEARHQTLLREYDAAETLAPGCVHEDQYARVSRIKQLANSVRTARRIDLIRAVRPTGR